MRIGIDLGGTKIEAIALDEFGAELMRFRVPAPQGVYEKTLCVLVELVRHIESSTQQAGRVGVCIPGAIDSQTGLVKNANSVWLIGQPLLTDLQNQLNRDIRIENDANCFVISEATDGAASGYDVVFGVIIGTGCGGGLFVRGQPLLGVNQIAGEWGHNPLPWPTPEELPGAKCYCGQKGCIETWLSGPGFARDHKNQGGIGAPAKQIVASIEEDKTALQSLMRYEDRLARCLATVINLLDPGVIVLGGGMSNIKRLYERVPAIWSAYVFTDSPRTKLVPPMYTDSSGVRGAAWLWPKII